MQQTNQILIEARGITLQRIGELTPLVSHIDMFLGSARQALIGRNGIGKSWLAAVLAGRADPTEGAVLRFCNVDYLAQQAVVFKGTGADLLGLTSYERAMERIHIGSGCQADYDLMEGHWDWQHRIEQLMLEGELKFSILDQPFNSLSGGEQTRLQLLALKYRGSDFLILDEPSNHLDRQGRIWLAGWLQSFHGGILLISHDNNLLDRVEDIYELSEGRISHSTGGWQSWLYSREQLRLGFQREAEQTQKRVQQIKRDKQKASEKMAKRQRQGKQNRKNANLSKLILDQALESSQGTLSRQFKQYSESLQRASSEASEAKTKLEVIDPLAIVPAPPEIVVNPLLCLQDVILPFGSSSRISLTINQEERLVIRGSNGSGKSTLLKVMTKLIDPLQGECQITRSHKMMDQYFSFLDKTQSAFYNFQKQSPGWQEDNYRTRLAQLRIRGDKALKPVEQLSGGEQLKVALACLFCGAIAPALLLLDEPDNHLDIESRELLQQVLHDYTGAFV